MSGAASSFTEEDRFPLFFLGVSSGLMLVFCGVPCLRWFVGLLVVCIRGILRGEAHPRRRSASEDTDHNIESYARAAGNVLSEYLAPLGCLLSVLKYPRWFVAALQLQWHHPRLFSQHVFPHVTRYVVHARRLLLVVWFVSIMLHVNTVPRAVHYETLGLPPTATREEVRSAYRKLSFRYHPDKDASVEARDLYSKIRYAYHRLTGDRGDGDSRFAGEEDVGVGVALPRFLRDTEHEGRTLLLLLTIAFGVPGFLVYWFFLRTPMTYQKRHNSLIRNVALAARLFDALGVPPTLRREEECKHCEMTEKLLREAGLWGATMKREDLLRIVPIPLPTLLKFCLILKQEELHGKRVIQEAKDRLAGVGLDEEACRTAFIQCISQEPWLSAVRSMTAQPFQTKGYANSSYVAPPPHVCEAIAYFLESVLEAIRDDLIPFDIQGKSKKLMKLYEDKTNLLKKMAQIYHTSSSRPPPSLFDRLYDISEEIGTTHADIDRSSIEYLTAQQRRNLRRYLAAANTTMQ